MPEIEYVASSTQPAYALVLSDDGRTVLARFEGSPGDRDLEAAIADFLRALAEAQVAAEPPPPPEDPHAGEHKKRVSRVVVDENTGGASVEVVEEETGRVIGRLAVAASPEARAAAKVALARLEHPEPEEPDPEQPARRLDKAELEAFVKERRRDRPEPARAPNGGAGAASR